MTNPKKPRKKRTTGRGLWDDDGHFCFSNPYFRNKLGKRQQLGLCIACGRKKDDCVCKSSETTMTEEEKKEKKKRNKKWWNFSSPSSTARMEKEIKMEHRRERKKREEDRIANKAW